MDPAGQSLLNDIADAMERLLRGDIPGEIGCNAVETDDCARRTRETANRFIRAFAEAGPFLLDLSAGNLERDPPPRNFLISPFKQLQANLRHLTWQTRQIAAGDLSQHVDFLGEFSVCFNAMIASLREKRAVEEALRRSEKRLRDITDALGEGVYVLNTAGELAFMNPEAERLLGWSEAELRGKKVHDIFHCRRPDGSRFPESECPVHATFRSGRICRCDDDVFTRKDGKQVPVAFVATPVIEDGVVAGSVAVFHDITPFKRSQEVLQRANALLEEQASTDPLTGLANRARFDMAFGREISRAKRHALPLTLIMFDIDRFKRINDTFGHRIGDLVLQELAHLAQRRLRQEDLLARWGGEEFVILLPHTDIGGGKLVAERLRREVEQTEFSVAGAVTISLGVAQLRPDDEAAMLLERADQALYRAKEDGRNRVESDLA